MNDLPLIKITIGGKICNVISHWWDENDFYFINDKNETFRYKNAYLTSINFGGLELSESDICEIEPSKEYHLAGD